MSDQHGCAIKRKRTILTAAIRVYTQPLKIDQGFDVRACTSSAPLLQRRGTEAARGPRFHETAAKDSLASVVFFVVGGGEDDARTRARYSRPQSTNSTAGSTTLHTPGLPTLFSAGSHLEDGGPVLALSPVVDRMRCPALVAPSAAWLLSLSNVDDFRFYRTARDVQCKRGKAGGARRIVVGKERSVKQFFFRPLFWKLELPLTNTGHSHAALLTQLKLKTHSLHRWALSGRVPYDSTAASLTFFKSFSNLSSAFSRFTPSSTLPSPWFAHRDVILFKRPKNIDTRVDMPAGIALVAA
ncbi:hypothetical protein C8F04DRAFT_1184283 [Mycena alexandri]|uniref:Uncharacterized protein n=1 Tax=Mycena alexandri TaxID=1745969 RepID=A0AAD6STT5_9AGAR|nr:hypothetical protein C8F04DRAFT_1184283 [Mycena alexandri]